jgi:hypothetical protein
LTFSPQPSFSWVFRNWHTLITPIYYNMEGYKNATY